MKYKDTGRDNSRLQALRELLIRCEDQALAAEEPDMTVVEECNALLDALEQGNCRPNKRRMRRELHQLKKEIRRRTLQHQEADTFADEGFAAPKEPMPAYRIWMRAAACMLLVVLLPLSILFLRSQYRRMETVPSDTPSVSSTATETGSVLYDGSVMCLRGNIVAQYPDLASCMEYEAPGVYYPTLLPGGCVLTAVRIHEQDMYTEIRFEYSDARYRMDVLCPSEPREDTERDRQAEMVDAGYTAISLAGRNETYRYDAYEKTDGDGYSLMLYLDDDIRYELVMPDAATAQALFRSMRNAEADHVHCWISVLISVPTTGDETKRKVQKSCSICESEEQEETHEHEWTYSCSFVYPDIVVIQKTCDVCLECEDLAKEKHVNEETDPDRLALWIEQEERDLAWIAAHLDADWPEDTNRIALRSVLGREYAAHLEWLIDAKRRLVQLRVEDVSAHEWEIEDQSYVTIQGDWIQDAVRWECTDCGMTFMSDTLRDVGEIDDRTTLENLISNAYTEIALLDRYIDTDENNSDDRAQYAQRRDAALKEWIQDAEKRLRALYEGG